MCSLGIPHLSDPQQGLHGMSQETRHKLLCVQPLHSAVVQGLIKSRAETRKHLECLSRNCAPNEPLRKDDTCGWGSGCQTHSCAHNCFLLYTVMPAWWEMTGPEQTCVGWAGLREVPAQPLCCSQHPQSSWSDAVQCWHPDIQGCTTGWGLVHRKREQT